MPGNLAKELRAALRRNSPDAQWRPQYSVAMKTAYRENDHESIAELAAAASAYLDAEGRHVEALAEIEYALALTRAAPVRHAQMLRIHAWFEMMAGDLAAARDSLRRAEGVLPSPDPESAADQLARSALLEVLALTPEAPDILGRAIFADETQSLEGLSALCKLWLAIASFDMGRVPHAAPWVRALEAHGAAQANRWRMAESRELTRCLELIRQAPTPCDHEEEPDPAGRGYIAEWLHAGHLSYSAFRLRGAAESTGEAWKTARSRLPVAYMTAGDGFDAVIEAHTTSGPSLAVSPPALVTLLNAGMSLAAGEAVAIAGTQSEAVTWSTWFSSRWPASLHTAAEWPASAKRVQALLLARSGNLRGAVTMMKEAVRWTRTAGFLVEHAVSLIQLAELLALAPGAVRRQEWTGIRTEGRDLARVIGLDAAAIGDAALSAAALGKFDAERPLLTPREVEVLRLFRSGQTYREAGATLGLDWRTVQTHAKNIYAKLEVASKTTAVIRAGELGLL